ncbi:hypothetical protein KKB83_00835 [Patescibacteria group bacterium]|nr:hypothetical protein [Patescibacteria group bacterium]
METIITDLGLDTIVDYAPRVFCLPLKDLFCNKKLEFGLALSDLKVLFEGLGLIQFQPVLVTT